MRPKPPPLPTPHVECQAGEYKDGFEATQGEVSRRSKETFLSIVFSMAFENPFASDYSMESLLNFVFCFVGSLWAYGTMLADRSDGVAARWKREIQKSFKAKDFLAS